MSKTTVILPLAVLAFGLCQAVHADEVLRWNAVLQQTLVATNNAGPTGPRMAAIVHAAMFDAVNGVERRYNHIHVEPAALPGASRRTAVVYAAHATLSALFPSQTALLDAELQRSMEEIAPDPAVAHSASIRRGREWGAFVAAAILEWRNGDGYNTPLPPYFGGVSPGIWRPTPPVFAPGLIPSLARTIPFIIPSPAMFRPSGPPTLDSQKYAQEFNEVKVLGSLASAVRTPDQTQAARFWAATALTFWNRAAALASTLRRLTLSENARLFALLNLAMADGAIVCWDSKYLYEFWRPVTAIRLASTDGNPDTIEDAGWTPLVVTPPFPEYLSFHGVVSGAAQTILTSYFGAAFPFDGTSEGLPGVSRRWSSFSDAADEANLARIWGGIHFRRAVVDARKAGDDIGSFCLNTALRPIHKGTLKPSW
ncbi:MAG: vanadium-dependent haloperoxidase [Bryobacteraceae bacterium]|nr:vanadium-dependent haloperoxidase [Bryobacteraceae bacterium]